MVEPSDMNGFNAPFKRNDQDNISENVIELSSSDSEDENAQYSNDYHKQLVLYDHSVNEGSLVEAFPDLVSFKPAAFKRILPSVEAYTVQCANCFKWRLIPTKKKYEEIREHIIENPFVCETAHEWRPGVSCNDPPDVEQDESRLWAIDKPNIVQPPPGWERILRIRGAGSTKFGDIYYTSPTSKKVLRSITDIKQHLEEYPEYVKQGVTPSQFSFQVPNPLQKDYVRPRPHQIRPRPHRKSPSGVDAIQDSSGIGMPESLEPPPGLQDSDGSGMPEYFEPSPGVQDSTGIAMLKSSEPYPGSQVTSGTGMPESFKRSPDLKLKFAEELSNLKKYIETSQNTEKQQGNKWNLAEDLALMLARCVASEATICSTSQNIWGRTMRLYNTAQAEYPDYIFERSLNQMKDRYKLVNKNAKRWITTYREAYRQKQSGMSLKDVENEALKMYGVNGSKFNNLIVFNEVMCKHPKWDLHIDRDTTCRSPEWEADDDENGFSTKRLKTCEEGDYSNPETSNCGGSTSCVE